MSLIGTTLTFWVGPTVPTPPPPAFLEALDEIEVTTSDDQRSGFRLTFRVGRDATMPLDYDLLTGPLLQPCSRVLLMVTFNALPQVLMDGIITNQQLSPGQQAGTSTLTVIGEDVSVMMDLEERSVEHPAQNEMVIALKLIASYAQFGLIPMVLPPPSLDVPLPTERIPVQQDTDLQYLQKMAQRFGYVFYVTPGPAPLTNLAYWGPPERLGLPQRALKTNVGANTNVDSISFQYDGLAPTKVEGRVQDRRTNQTMPVQNLGTTRVPPLAAQNALLTQGCTRVRQFRQSGLDATQALARVQGQADAATDRTVTATGELDALRYENLLTPRGLVGLQGAGFSYDGLYYVKQVTHKIREGAYAQHFTLTREGVGSITPVVVP
ncbi:MAG: hypothetical protein R3247_06730 [Rhodothermales bacterium]|nr:hypothetical protein [Rhodothermales bacterium]